MEFPTVVLPRTINIDVIPQFSHFTLKTETATFSEMLVNQSTLKDIVITHECKEEHVWVWNCEKVEQTAEI
jgi:hypothetical protein